MDLPQPLTPALERDLENLEAINRNFGGLETWSFFARRWLQPGGHYRLLDLATGGGDGPRCLVQYARHIGAEVQIVAVDSQTATLEFAARRSAGFPEIVFREGDVRTFLPSPGDDYDYALCSLALHHFSEDDAVRILLRLREIPRYGAMAADLSRGLVCSIGAWLITQFLYREPMTVDDARASARRAFSPAEFRALICRAQWANPGRHRFRFARQAAWWEKPRKLSG